MKNTYVSERFLELLLLGYKMFLLFRQADLLFFEFLCIFDESVSQFLDFLFMLALSNSREG